MAPIVNELPIVLTGFFFGILHSFDIDHITTVSTIASRTKNLIKAMFLGLWWGIGHAATVFFIGMLILVFKIAIPQQFSVAVEFLIGFVLVFLGFQIIHDIIIKRGHFHKHKHGTIEHSHFHYHNSSKYHNHNHTSLYIGMLHGLAGSAAVMLLVLATLNSLFTGLLFILTFGLGSLLSMSLIGVLVSFPLLHSQKYPKVNILLRGLIGFFSIYIGTNIITKILFI